MAAPAPRVSPSGNKKIFLSWGGDDALKIAHWLKEIVFDFLPGYDAFLSEQIEAGEEFVNRIHDELRTATGAIGIMTDAALDRPWFLYEIAFLKSRLDDIPLLKFCSDLPEGHPLKVVQYKSGWELSRLKELFTDVLKGCDGKVLKVCHERLDAKAQEWNSLTASLRSRKERTGSLRVSTANAITAILDYKTRGNAEAHPCMQAVACKTLEDVTKAFQGLVDQKHPTYRIDYRRYPEYLLYLQRSPLEVTTSAIAVVNDVEEFWAHKTGDAILESTHPDSTRVFVFENQGTFSMYCRYLFRHAEKYNVLVMSAREFGRIRQRVTRDFSVIIDRKTGDRMTAYYDNAADNIHFTTDRQIVEQKLSVFQEVLDWAHRISVPSPSKWGEYEKELCETMFADRVQEAGQHSDVIPIERYDAFEEDHPYYRDMHQTMLAEFRKRVSDVDIDFRVLEIGAGTGLFTKRLAQHPYPGMAIVAMEPDAKAHPLLLRKLQRKPNIVQPVLASILTYDPRGEFRFVFSSFSEHHIRPEDKDQYFNVVTGTMEHGGYLIIGDEFLSLSRPNDPAAYEQALERYHTYIITKAREAHHFEVAELERLAMESGRPGSKERVDFKVSLPWYKEKAKAAGLLLEAEHCITPSELAGEIGGMYVLIYRKP